MYSCTVGTKGRFIASAREFEIVEVTSRTSIIRFRGESKLYGPLEDDDLSKSADQIEKFND
jgi:hypothetical protein